MIRNLIGARRNHGEHRIPGVDRNVRGEKLGVRQGNGGAAKGHQDAAVLGVGGKGGGEGRAGGSRGAGEAGGPGGPGTTITVVEGNMGSPSHVGTRKIQVNARYIRGYCCPDYASMADNTEEDNMKLYKYVNELPYGQEAVTKAIQNGYINLAEDGSMGLWEPNIQTIILMNRAGMFDKPAIEGR